jgi:hypothetical protein
VGAPFLTGESAASFEISSDTCSQAAVAPGGTCSISVAFGPSTIGAKLAEMTIPATNSPYGDETVSLSGEGIDPVPPVASITSNPRKAANSNSATFRFQSDIVNSSFQCRLDGRAWTSCASPKTYKSIPFGQHIFRVRAIANSLTGPVASYSWAIKRKRG